jgi:mono/diheme cytochrome c family protein
MHRRAIHILFMAAALLSTTPACDKGGDTKDVKKGGDDNKAPIADEKAADPAQDSGKVEEPPKADTGAAEAGTPPAEEGGEVEPPADTGTAPAAEAGGEEGEKDDAGEKDGGEKAVKDPPKDPPKDGGGETAAKIDAKPLFEAKCKACHGVDGKGETTIGKKENIPSLVGTKLSKAKIISTIEVGVPDTKMKGYKDKLSKEEIDAIAGYVKKL